MKRIIAIVCLMFTFSVSFASGGGGTNEHKQLKENFVESVAVTPSVAQMTADIYVANDFVVSNFQIPAPTDVGWSPEFSINTVATTDRITYTIPSNYRICERLEFSKSVNKIKYTEIPIHFNRKC